MVVDGGCIVCSLRISQATERFLYIHRRLLAGQQPKHRRGHRFHQNLETKKFFTFVHNHTF